MTLLGAEKLRFIMSTTISWWINYLGIGLGRGQCSETLLLCINKQRSVLFCLDVLCIFLVKVDDTFLT